MGAEELDPVFYCAGKWDLAQKKGCAIRAVGASGSWGGHGVIGHLQRTFLAVFGDRGTLIFLRGC